MSLREILHLTQQPVESKVTFAASTFKCLVSLLLQMFQVCEDEEVELSRKIHCFDLKSNEWHIAAVQIYENLFRMETMEKNERGEIKFDNEGNVIEAHESKEGRKAGLESMPTMSGALKPLLQFIDGYRRRVAAPENTLIHKKYAKYADLTYIAKRIKFVEDSVHDQIYRGNKGLDDGPIADYIDGDQFERGDSIMSGRVGRQFNTAS